MFIAHYRRSRWKFLNMNQHERGTLKERTDGINGM